MDTALSPDGRELVEELTRTVRAAIGGFSVPFEASLAEVESHFRGVHDVVRDGGWHELAASATDSDENAAVLAAMVENTARARTTVPYPFSESFAARRLLATLGREDLAMDPGSISADFGAMSDPHTPIAFSFGPWVDHRYFLSRANGGYELRDANGADLDARPLEQPDSTRPLFRLSADAIERSVVIANVDSETGARSAWELVLFEAAELLGVASGLFDATVEHLNTREQFGAPLSSFQALRHRAVDVFAEIETLRSLVNYASWVADARPEHLAEFAAMAKGYGSRAAWHAGDEAIQMHGAMGFTWEQGLHVPLGRAMSRALSSPTGVDCLASVGRGVLGRGEFVSLLA